MFALAVALAVGMTTPVVAKPRHKSTKHVQIMITTWEANPGKSGPAGSTIKFCASTPPLYLYTKGSVSGAKPGETVSITSTLNGQHYDSNSFKLTKKSGHGILDSIGDGSTPLGAGVWAVKFVESGKTIATSSATLQADPSC
jgi:hypothetical protein